MNYKKLTAILFLFACFAKSSYSQKTNSFSRHTVYADFASHGAYYSVNYDRIFSRGEKLAKTYRIGFSVIQNAVAMPVGINFFTGHEASHVEFGLTVVPYIETYTDPYWGTKETDKKIYIIPGAGYRYQKPEGGFFFKVIAGPVIYLDPPSDDFWKMDGKVYPGITAGLGFSF